MGNNPERTSHGYYTDRAQRPDEADFEKLLSHAWDPWLELIQHLNETYQLTGTLHFMYGPRYGWALRFQRGGRLLLALYPNQGSLTVQVILGLSQVHTALRMKLSSQISTVLRSAKKYPEGRWLFIPVKSKTGIRDLKPLIALKITGSKG